MKVKPKFTWSYEVHDYVYDNFDIKCSVEEILIINKALSIIVNYGGANPYDRTKAKELIKVIKEGVSQNVLC